MAEQTPNVGIVGTHVKHSLSPVMHNAAYREMGVDLHYGAYQVPEIATMESRREFFDAFLRMQAEDGVIGMSVTMPFKEDIISSSEVGVLSESATNIGAANTLSGHVQGKWSAENTDWLGAVVALEEAGVSITDKTALVLGAGGTARAVTYGLGMRKAHQVIIANRTMANAEAVAADLQPHLERTHVNPFDLSNISNGRISDSGKNVARSVDIVYNTTSRGQNGTDGECRLPVSLVTLDEFRADATIVDAVYIPVDTPLISYARERGLRCISGTRMLLHQAVEQVKIFTGEADVPIEVMDKALHDELLRRSLNQ